MRDGLTHIPRVVEAVRPQLVFYQAGVDPMAGDRLGKLSLSREGLQGTLPTQLGALTNLEHLNLFSNLASCCMQLRFLLGAATRLGRTGTHVLMEHYQYVQKGETQVVTEIENRQRQVG
mgnify:CR=1 FL=1